MNGTINLHMSNLLNLETVKLISDLKGLCALYDEVETQARSLNNLGLQPNHYRPMFIPVLMNKLPKKFKIKTFGTFLKFGTFLNVNLLRQKKLRHNTI